MLSTQSKCTPHIEAFCDVRKMGFRAEDTSFNQILTNKNSPILLVKFMFATK